MSTVEDLRLRLADWTGIDLRRGGVARALERHVEQRREQLGLRSLREYLALLDGPHSAEFQQLVSTITVSYTWFFRDLGQFVALDALLRQPGDASRCIHVWVPGCATGEDAYSIALLAEQAHVSVDVLGTDLSARALSAAEDARYGKWSVRDVPASLREHFEREPSGAHRLLDAVKGRVRFRHHNLVDPPPPSPSGRGWDVILCRNVLIYFVRDEARRVFERLARELAPGGHLLFGASEVVFDVPESLQAVYVAGRLALRRRHPEHPPLEPFESTRASSLIASVGRAQLHAPVTALPTTARQVARPTRNHATEMLRPTLTDTDRDLNEGHTLLDAGDVAAASVVYMRAAERNTTRADARMYAGIALYLCGDIDRALHELRAASFLDGTLWAAAFYLALCYESMGLPENAVQEYRHVVRLHEQGKAAGHARVSSTLSAWHQDLLELARTRIARHARTAGAAW